MTAFLRPASHPPGAGPPESLPPPAMSMSHRLLLRMSFLAAGAVIAAVAALPALAGVQLNTTRVVYPASENEVTVKLTNRGGEPVLMQVWVDRGNPDIQPRDSDAPFLVTPPIFRLDPAKGQSVRVLFTGEALPQDRESLFWFNALEVPALPAEDSGNFMQIATRSRLKLFYRPAALKGDLPSAIRQVQWQVVETDRGHVLRGRNPGPYYLSYSRLDLERGAKRYETGGGMIAPFASFDFPLPGYTAGAGGKLRYRWMSDYGASSEQEVPIP